MNVAKEAQELGKADGLARRYPIVKLSPSLQLQWSGFMPQQFGTDPMTTHVFADSYIRGYESGKRQSWFGT